MDSRKEFIFFVDGRNINPNGDPHDNRPRRFPDGTNYQNNTRLNRYFRDQAQLEGHRILVSKQDGETVTLKAVIGQWAEEHMDEIKAEEEAPGKKGKKGKKATIDGKKAVRALCDTYIDVRVNGSGLAIKDIKFTPKALVGPLQVGIGITPHEVEEVTVVGTSVMGSDEDREQGTWGLEKSILRYAFYGWHGIVNEHNAKITGMTEEDYYYYLRTIRRGIQGCNTYSKMGQVPRLLVSISNKEGCEHQFGNLLDYVTLRPRNGLGEREWTSPFDFSVDLSRLIERIEMYSHCIEKVEFEIHPDLNLTVPIPDHWEYMNLDELPPKVASNLLASFKEAK